MGDKILVLPFQAVNPSETNSWVGKSVQQSLVADITAMAPDRVVTSDQFAVTVESAITMGRQAGARYVVAGGFVTMGHDLRITGQILDVESGKPVGALKVTGDPAQVFRMEDGLAMQLKSRLFPDQTPSGEQQPMQTQVQPQVQVPEPQPTAASVRSDYNAYLNQPLQTPYYSSYASVPPQTAYGSDYNTYNYYPTPSYDYSDSGYDPYFYSGLGYPYSPYYGVGLGFYYGNGHYRYADHGHAYHGNALGGRGNYGSSYGYAGGFRTNASISGGYRAASVARGGSTFRSAATPFHSSGSFGGTHSSFSSHASGGHGGGHR